MDHVESVINPIWKVFMGMDTPELSPKERRILESLLQEENLESSWQKTQRRIKKEKIQKHLKQLDAEDAELEYQDAVKCLEGLDTNLEVLGQKMVNLLKPSGAIDCPQAKSEVKAPRETPYEILNRKEEKSMSPTVREERKGVITSILDHMEYCPSYHVLRTQRMFDKLSLLDLEHLNSLVQEVSWGCVGMPMPDQADMNPPLPRNTDLVLIEQAEDFADDGGELADMDLWDQPDDARKWPDEHVARAQGK